jgi:hypothetical protein
MSGSVGGIVTFNYAEWSTLFPEFSNITSGQAQLYFNLAQRYCDNTVNSPVSDSSVGGERDTYLNLLTAHIAFLLGGTSTQPAAQLVGRISDASEGSVRVSTDWPEAANASQAWFMQSKYGVMFWAATSQYRAGGFYVPPIAKPVVQITGSQFPGSVFTYPPYGY